MYSSFKRKKRKTSKTKILVGTYFDTLTPQSKIIYKEKNQPNGCQCKGDDLVYGNGTYWYCANCHLNEWRKK
jgi:hypothetical protein